MKHPYKILFKFASRSRPEKFFKGLENIVNNLDDVKNYMILCSLDKDDVSMYNKQVLTKLKAYIQKYNLSVYFGTSKNKIDAINRDFEKISYDWDIVVNFSDDMVFQKKGFDTIIRKKFKSQFPDLDGCLHFNDGYTKDKIITMSILGRTYTKRFNYPIYPYAYKSLWCDNEQTIVAQRLGKYDYYDEVIFKHEHPMNSGGVIDELLISTESYGEEDRLTFENRKQANFYINQ